MRDIKFLLQRDVCAPGFTLGRLIVEGKLYGYTCEDKDRKLEENPGAKIKGRTAIPRGLYRMTLSFSNRFQKMLPLLEDVPGFTGVRIHGGNTSEDTEGCILLGKVYVPATNPTGIANCAERMSTLIQMLTDAEDAGTECWITVE